MTRDEAITAIKAAGFEPGKEKDGVTLSIDQYLTLEDRCVVIVARKGASGACTEYADHVPTIIGVVTK